MKPTELATRLGLTEDPSPLQFLGEAAYLWLDLGHADKAAQIFDTLICLCPGDPTGYLGLGEARMKEGRHKLAVQAFKKATQSPRGQVDSLAYAWRKLGDAQMLAGNRAMAEKAWAEAVQIDPEGTDGRLALQRQGSLHDGSSIDEMDALLDRLRDHFPGANDEVG